MSEHLTKPTCRDVWLVLPTEPPGVALVAIIAATKRNDDRIGKALRILIGEGCVGFGGTPGHRKYWRVGPEPAWTPPQIRDASPARRKDHSEQDAAFAKLYTETSLSLELIGERFGITKNAAVGLAFRLRQAGVIATTRAPHNSRPGKRGPRRVNVHPVWPAVPPQSHETVLDTVRDKVRPVVCVATMAPARSHAPAKVVEAQPGVAPTLRGGAAGNPGGDSQKGQGPLVAAGTTPTAMTWQEIRHYALHHCHWDIRCRDDLAAFNKGRIRRGEPPIWIKQDRAA